MSVGEQVPIGDIVRLPPMILGTIRWKSGIGRPEGGPCQGFDFLVEERTPTQFRVGPGGIIEPIPGSSKWIVLPDAVTCNPSAEENGVQAVSFWVRGLHLNLLPNGAYRITPTLKGNWRPSGIFAPLGYRVIEPSSVYVSLWPQSQVQSVEFEVLRRSFFGGRVLSTA